MKSGGNYGEVVKSLSIDGVQVTVPISIFTSLVMGTFFEQIKAYEQLPVKCVQFLELVCYTRTCT